MAAPCSADVERAAAAALVLAAEVVEVEVAVRADSGRRSRCRRAAVRVGAAERKGDPVVGAQALRRARARRGASRSPSLLRDAQRRGRRVEHHRQRPRLVVEVELRVGHRRHGVAEQAEAGHARLRAMAVLDLGLDERRGVARQSPASASTLRSPRALRTIGSMCSAPALRRTPNASPSPKRWLRSTAPTHAAALAPFEEGRAQRRVERALDDEVDQAARRARAGLDAAQALQDVDARLVLERDRGLGVDRQAVAAEVEAVVDDEAAHGEVVDVALGVVGRRHRRIEARQVGEAARAGVADLRGVDARRRERRLRRAARRPSRRRSPAPAPCR